MHSTIIMDRDGPGCEFEKHLPDADVVISQPFFPAYLTAERIKMAPSMSREFESKAVAENPQMGRRPPRVWLSLRTRYLCAYMENACC